MILLELDTIDIRQQAPIISIERSCNIVCSIDVTITAEVSQILVSCEMPIQWEQFSLVFITNIHAASGQFVCIIIFMSSHRSAGTCIPVASVAPIHVPPIQHVLKHCHAHILHNQV